MELGLKNKISLVMGASSGLGYAIAKELIAEGSSVAISSRDEERLQLAKLQLGARLALTADFRKSRSAADLVHHVVDALGKVDVLVCNTGGPPKGGFEKISIEDWTSEFQNLWLSVVESVQASLPGMKERKWGRIIFVTSVAAKEPMNELTISNGFRAGLLGLTKTLSNEFARFGITVNALLPGYTRTERLQELGIAEDKMTSQIPAQRLGEPQELAALAAFIASEKAAYITGQAIACDGGYLKSNS